MVWKDLSIRAAQLPGRDDQPGRSNRPYWWAGSFVVLLLVCVGVVVVVGVELLGELELLGGGAEVVDAGTPDAVCVVVLAVVVSVETLVLTVTVAVEDALVEVTPVEVVPVEVVLDVVEVSVPSRLSVSTSELSCRRSIVEATSGFSSASSPLPSAVWSAGVAPARTNWPVARPVCT